MKKYICFTLVTLGILVLGLNSSRASEVEHCSSTIHVFKQSPQVQPYFKNAYGYAVFPTVGKGGLGVGGAYGKGQVYRGGKITGKTSLKKLSIGFQIGGQAFSQIIFFQNKLAYDEFTSGHFAFDAQASVVALTAGAQSQAGSTGATAGVSSGPENILQAKINYYKGMAVFKYTKGGLLYDASIAGQKFNFEPSKDFI